MALDVQRISLDISKQPTPQQVRLGQGDANATQLVVSVFDDGIAYSLNSYSVRLEMRLPNSDNYYSVDGTRSGNVATFDIDETYAATSYGFDGFGYVDILSGDTVICSTSRFQLVVLQNAQEGADPSTAYSNGIAEATERANDAAEAAEGVVLQAVPLMSATIRGGAQLGDGLSVVDGALSLSDESYTSAEKTKLAGIEANANNYALPTMGASTKGGAKLGSGLTVSDDTLSLGSHVHAAGDITSGNELTLRSNNVKIDTSANNGVSSNTAVGFMSISGKDNYWAGRVGAYIHSNGSAVSYLGAQNKKTDGTDVTNYIQAGVTKAGEPYYWMTSPAAFRKALGFADSAWTTQDDTGPAVSVANSSWAKLTQVTLTAGCWLVLVAGYAASSNTGRRGFHLSSASSVTAARFLSAFMAPPSGTALYTVIPYLVNPTASTTYNIFGYQNSGGNLNMSALVCAIHIYTA